ncbi:MAG: 2-hydroxyacyl-CoA dehydratase [Candidatus Faecousia sp.]|nr:2-hydroxyacyl-CoA dehydratase [Bacillota bacterium]MDY2809455.1 2-hydroxyacyl-CoA dehydratase [Candidatus Faecousia sp.]
MFVDFTKEMKAEYTIIAPDIFPTHMKLLEAVFRLYGYNVVIAKYEGQAVINTGLKYLHNDVCYPAICMLGQQLHALTCGDFDPHKCALIQFQTGGGCRASNYLWLLRKALEKMDMEYVPVISLSFGGYEHYSGFKITPGMMATGIRSLIYGDMLLLLKNQCLPYEQNEGDTRRVVEKWIASLTDQFRRKEGLSAGTMKKNLAAMAKDFHDIPKVKRDTVKVGIVGEIYVKYSSFGNNGLEKFLLSQGCEYMVPGVLGFFQYCFANMDTDYRYYGGSSLKHFAGGRLEKIAEGWEGWLIDALKPYPEFAAPVSFEKVKKLADRVIDRGVKMGEGWLLPGEAAELIEKGYSNIICTQPFGCLPNHIVGKGTIRRLRELYPQANIFPVDYDAGASKVNQENRIKLMLAMAKEGLQ